MRYYFLLMFFLVAMMGYAQQTDTVKTAYLQEVSIYGMPVTRYATGTKVDHIDATGTSLLNNALSQSSSIYFKNYGNDQLSTIAFRGTSSSHTAVLWNGMNISSPTLGQTDFSLLPSFL